MAEIEIRTQAELDALPDVFAEYTTIRITGGATVAPLVLRRFWGSASVEASGSASVEASGSASVVAWGSASVEASGSASVEASGSASVVASGSARVEASGSARVVASGSASVVASGSASVVAWGSARVVASGSASVVASGSARVEAWGSASVVAWGSARVVASGSASVVASGSARVVASGSARVEAWGSASVVASGSARVEAWGSASVEAWGSARVEASGTVSVHIRSARVVVTLLAFAVAFAHEPGNVTRKSETVMIVTPKRGSGVSGWLADHALDPGAAGKVVLYKRVSSEWLTQEGTPNATTWRPGTTFAHPAWAPESGECGAGKYHFCPRPYFADEFRGTAGDRYVACSLAVADLHAWDGGKYPHKIAGRAGVVLYECDRWGDEVKGFV